MPPTLRAALLACPLVAGPLAASAHVPPAIFPTHDVAVTYDVRGGHGAPRSAVMHWSAELGTMRLDTEGRREFVLLDPGADRMELVLPLMHLALRAALRDTPAGDLVPGRDARFTRAGSAVIAGRPCAVWTVSMPQGSGTVCLTRGGVLLRGVGHDAHGQGGSVIATSVRDETQPPDLFALPPDVRAMDLPPGLFRDGRLQLGAPQ